MHTALQKPELPKETLIEAFLSLAPDRKKKDIAYGCLYSHYLQTNGQNPSRADQDFRSFLKRDWDNLVPEKIDHLKNLAAEQEKLNGG